MEPIQISRIMTTEVVSVTPDCLLTKAVDIMQQHNISILIIILDQKPMGVLTERDIVRLACEHAKPEQVKIRDVMTSPVITVTEDKNVFQVYDKLNTHKIRHIIVVNAAGQLAGLATLTNILGGLSLEYFVELKQITTIMSRNICFLNPGDTVKTALELMYQKQISCVIIAKGNKPVGILTERDIARQYCSIIDQDARVETIMSHPVRTVPSETFIPEANTIMKEEKLRHLVAVDRHGNLAGLISQSDVARRIENHYIAFLQTLVKQQKEQIQYENERFSTLFMQNPNAMMSYDIDGNIIDINPACVALLGYSEQEISNKPLEYLIHAEDIACARESFHRATEERTGHAEFRIKVKSGDVVHVFNSYLPIHIDKKLLKIYSIMHDISEQKKNQQQMHQIEEKFRQAQKMEALGTLVGGIAHDFNNILAGMTGNLYLAKKKASDRPDVLMRLNTVEKLSYQAGDMIKQLLAFARKDTVEMNPFGLTSFMQEVSTLTKAGIPENIKFHNRFCQKELVVKGNATQLQQVLMNLLSNACDAVSDVPEPVISLTIEEFEADEHFLTTHSGISGSAFAHFIIKDNGTGISDEDKAHIFEPFYTTKEVGVGTGLGLAMCYGTIHSHGGILEVKSTFREGSSFHIYLPLLQENMIDVERNELGETMPGNGELILVVDDNADIRATSKDVLESLGYRVLQAPDGIQAVDMFVSGQGEIALTIMDIVMPRLGGVKAAERIKILCPEAKFIFATGYDKDETLKGEMPSGDHIILSKPYNVIKLSKLIREQIDL